VGPPGPQGSPGASGSQVWQTYLFRLNFAYHRFDIYADTAIKVTRIQAQAAIPPVSCTSNGVISLGDGTPAGTQTLAITGAANDSGPIAINYSAGAILTLKVTTRASCSTGTEPNAAGLRQRSRAVQSPVNNFQGAFQVGWRGRLRALTSSEALRPSKRDPPSLGGRRMPTCTFL